MKWRLSEWMGWNDKDARQKNFRTFEIGATVRAAIWAICILGAVAIWAAQ
jgi:hypothetical protein